MLQEDFRLGNYILASQYFDEDEAQDDLQEDYSFENEWDLCKITSIENTDFAPFSYGLESIRNGNKPNPEIWNRLEPIEINEDYLIRFGFEKYPHGGNGFKFEGFVVYILRDSIEIEHTPAKFTDRVHVCSHIKYLHELQNLYYFLNGSELVYSPC